MSKGRNYVRNKPRTYVPTKVVGVRAEDEFWELVEKAAKIEGLTRNGLIVKVMMGYIYGESGK